MSLLWIFDIEERHVVSPTIKRSTELYTSDFMLLPDFHSFLRNIYDSQLKNNLIRTTFQYFTGTEVNSYQALIL